MRIRTSVLATLVVVIFFNFCNRNIVNLDYTNAKGEVQQLGNLIFRFDKGLVKDSLLNEWDSTEYISFEPKISGRFRWEHPDELVFSPSRPLPPATTFKAKFHDDILQYTKFGKIGKTKDVVFFTPILKLENFNVTWVLHDENSRTAVPQVDLYFNYSVKPELVKEKMTLELEGKPVDVSIHTLSPDKKVSFRVVNMKTEDKDFEAKVILDKGLVPEGGENATTATIETRVAIPSPYVLSINDVTAEHDGMGGTVFIRTSQQVISENLNSNIFLTPSVKFSVEQTDDGFAISSDNFDVSKSYLVTLKKGLRGRLGGILREQYDNNVAFGELAPSITFGNNRAVYLSSKGNRNIEARITNVPKVKVIISKIYESNILASQRYGYYPDDSRNTSSDRDFFEYDDYERSGNIAMGDIILEKEIETRLLPKYGNGRLFQFNHENQLEDFKGIYHIKIRSVDDYWVNDSRFISMSDLGLIAKEGSDKIVVFANSIRTTQGVQGVNISLYGNNNQLLGMGTTNEDGTAEVQYSRRNYSGFRPAMIIAKTADDFNYIPFSNTRVNTSRFEVGGKHSNSTGLDAFIYAERDIYRPGEKVNFSVIFRDRQWKSPGELPVKLKFLLPNGKELKSFRKTLNAQGSLVGDVDISTSAITGSYLLEVYTSNDILIATRNFNIEEFVPDRIRVTARLDKPILMPGQSTNLLINAINFFGPPAANRNYETEIQVKQKEFNPKKFENYTFSLANQNTFFDKIVREGKTDENGNASELFTVPDMYKNIGLLQGTFYATVFDETGRPVSRSAAADIYTQQVFFGVADDGYWYYPLNQTIRFPVVALDKNENVLSGVKADVRIVKHEYRTVLTKRGSYFNYESQVDDKIVAAHSLTVNGTNTVYPFIPRSPGDYEIRISVAGANSYVMKKFYSYGSWGATISSFQVNTEGNIDIEVDKISYSTGENVRALFKTPFSGRMLVTLENDKLLSSQYVNVENRTATLDLKMGVEHLPNVYITATLIKAHEISDIPLTVAHGFQNIKVEERNRKMAVEIIARKTVRSRTHQEVKVKAEPNSFVTLAAVDNGVLQVSDFKTPDPYGYFYAKKALEVRAFDMYPLLFPELVTRMSSTGGDGEASMDKRVNPMPAKRIRIVSYWSGIAHANSSGEADFEFDIPAFSGEIRLMAVAYRNESFGANEQTMTVADPIVLSTALPRFLSPNDTVSVPVTITNTTNKSTTAIATIKVEGPMNVIGNTRQTVTLNPNSENRALFQVVAAPSVSIGKVKVEVSSHGEKFTDEIEISVRPAAPLQVLTGSGSLTGNRSQTISIPTNNFLPGSSDFHLVVSRSPALEIGKHLRYLVQYPYGCTEQTISSAFPQLYFADLAEQMQLKNHAGATANWNVQETIRKIKLRQLYNGGLMLWENEGTEHWWTTIYAVHFLLEAQKAGFEVENSLLETMLSYCNKRLKNKETIFYYYNRDQRKKIAPKEVAYSLYVLAIAGKPNVSVMNYYKANGHLLSLDSKYLLSVAYAMAGDKKKFSELLPSSFSGEVSVPETGGSFYSDIRDEAISLNALLDVDPRNPQIPLMAKHVAQKLNQRSWYNTQECSFSFLSLGKLARAANKATITGEIKVNAKVIARSNGQSVRLTAKQLGNNNVEITTKGDGILYYYWQSEGISSSGEYKEEDSYLKVRKRFYDRFGRILNENNFSQNDLVIVQIALDKSYSGNVENIVITDLLPAGFEIENPRTREIPGMEWIKDAHTPLSLDVRDDRINLFVDLEKQRQTYYYSVRAVSPGTYRMGPVSADAMYNGEYHSYHGAGVVRIRN